MAPNSRIGPSTAIRRSASRSSPNAFKVAAIDAGLALYLVDRRQWPLLAGAAHRDPSIPPRAVAGLALADMGGLKAAASGTGWQ